MRSTSRPRASPTSSGAKPGAAPRPLPPPAPHGAGAHPSGADVPQRQGSDGLRRRERPEPFQPRFPEAPRCATDRPPGAHLGCRRGVEPAKSANGHEQWPMKLRANASHGRYRRPTTRPVWRVCSTRSSRPARVARQGPTGQPISATVPVLVRLLEQPARRSLLAHSRRSLRRAGRGGVPRCARGSPRCAGSAQVHAGLRALPEDGAADPRALSLARSRRRGAPTGPASSTRWTASAIATTSRRGRRRQSPRATRPAGRTGRARQGAPERGRQSRLADSPDGRLRAQFNDKDRNLYWSSVADGSRETRDHHRRQRRGRIKYGTASWVYGEELEQRTAMWWSPDSRKLAYYRFDETRVPRLLRRAEPDAAAEHGRHRGLPEGRRAESGRRSVRLRRRREADGPGRRPRRQAVRQRRRRPLRLSRDVVAGRPRAAVLPHEPPPERDGGRRRRTRRPAQCRVVLREEWPTGWVETNRRDACSSRTAGGSSGSRSATAGTTSICTI